jgi:hypothetical protein
MSHYSRTILHKYRSPMASACEHASNIKKKNREPFTRVDFLRNQKILDRHNAIFERIRLKNRIEQGPKRKVTVVRTTKTQMHATGIGDIPDCDFETLRLVALSEGYTHFRAHNRQTLQEL